MPVKSVIDVELNDAAFTRFKALYDRYEQQLKRMPAAWQEVNKTIDGTRKTFDAIVAKMVAQNVQARLLVEAQEKADRISRTTADRYREMARSTKEIASNIAGATTQLLKWASITGVISGLLGGGGLFGIERLAQSAAGQRRVAGGLGVSPGQAQSFGLNFGRFVDPGSMLSSVSAALSDPTNPAYRGILAALGGRPSGNAAQTSASILKSLPGLFPGGANDPLLGTRADALGLTNILSVEDIKRYLSASPSERNAQHAAFGADASRLGFGDQTGRAWQDFSTQMSRAGTAIENVFIKGLVGLAEPLGKLSSSFEKAVTEVFGNPKLKGWIEEFGKGIEAAAKYIASDDFRSAVSDFVGALGQMTAALTSAATWGRGATNVGKKIYSANRFATTVATGGANLLAERAYNWMNAPVTSGARSINNPGNLRPPGSSTGFQQFASKEDGIRAMAKQLLLYQDRDKLDTVEKIIAKYAPASENNVAAYVGDVSKRTGFAPDQKLDLHDPATMARLISAMTKHENVKNNFPEKVVVEIINNTGGSAVVSTSQVAR